MDEVCEHAERVFVAVSRGRASLDYRIQIMQVLISMQEREMNPYCNTHGIGLIPWGPLHAGDLARPLGTTTVRKEGAKGTPLEKKLSEADETIVRRVEEVAKKKGWSMNQVALAWIGKKVSSPIVGISSVRVFHILYEERVFEFMVSLG